MMKLIMATHNANKLAEIRAMLPEYDLLGLTDVGVQEDIPENEPTLEGNASIKARYLNQKLGVNCFADDTGLEIEALNGEPGVYSARYAGLEKSAEANMNLVLENLGDKPNRKAQFRTVIALIIDGNEHLFEGVSKGEITKTKHGNEGFGYDPIFKPEGYDITFAQMPLSEKNKISHRKRAVQKLVEYLQNL